jgi:hypothetical protein
LLKTPEDVEVLRGLIEAAQLARELPFETNLWKPQNIYFEISRTIRPEWSKRALQGDDAAKLWVLRFADLGEALGFYNAMQPEAQGYAPAEAAPVEAG